MPWHKFSICISTQVERELILINVLPFSLSDFSDENCVLPWIKKFLLVYMFLLNEFLQSETMQKLRSVQSINSIIAVADELSGAVVFRVIF